MTKYKYVNGKKYEVVPNHFLGSNLVGSAGDGGGDGGGDTVIKEPNPQLQISGTYEINTGVGSITEYKFVKLVDSTPEEVTIDFDVDTLFTMYLTKTIDVVIVFDVTDDGEPFIEKASTNPDVSYRPSNLIFNVWNSEADKHTYVRIKNTNNVIDVYYLGDSG